MRGLFCAGQVNGTSGYEEAAGQGLLAGINAARHAAGRDPIVLRRDQGYLGVMIDDLVTQEFVEPYRMLTSRAEHRLLLRGDNADLRLTPLAYDLGLVPRARYERTRAKETGRDAVLAALAATRLTDSAATGAALAAAGIAPLVGPATALDLLRRPALDYATLAAFLDAQGHPAPDGAGWREIPPTVAEQVEIEATYAHYIAAQQAQVARLAAMEGRAIPRDFDYSHAALPSLRAEARETGGDPPRHARPGRAHRRRHADRPGRAAGRRGAAPGGRAAARRRTGRTANAGENRVAPSRQRSREEDKPISGCADHARSCAVHCLPRRPMFGPLIRCRRHRGPHP